MATLGLRGQVIRAMALIMLTFTLLTFVIYTPFLVNESYEQEKEHISDFAKVLLTMRQVYRNRIGEAKLEINDSSIGLCPGGVISEMSDKFSSNSSARLTFNNVSDRARNPDNAADAGALTAIEFFKNNPAETKLYSDVSVEGGVLSACTAFVGRIILPELSWRA